MLETIREWGPVISGIGMLVFSGIATLALCRANRLNGWIKLEAYETDRRGGMELYYMITNTGPRTESVTMVERKCGKKWESERERYGLVRIEPGLVKTIVRFPGGQREVNGETTEVRVRTTRGGKAKFKMKKENRDIRKPEEQT